MSTDRDPAPSVVARRPPAPSGDLATVTRLLAAGDEREVVPVAAVQGSLALDRAGPAGASRRRRTCASSTAADSREHREVQAWAARFAQATVEVLGGDRPLSQLLRWTTARVYQDLDRRVRILGRTAPAPQRRRRSVRRSAACTSSSRSPAPPR